MSLKETPKAGDLIETKSKMFYVFERSRGDKWGRGKDGYEVKYLTENQVTVLKIPKGFYDTLLSSNIFTKNHGNIQDLMGHNKPLNQIIKEKEEKTMATDTTSKKLYEIEVDGKKLYGTHLATNSEGLWVMDVQGQQPVAVPKDSCEEVIPYSILVVNHFENKSYHMLAEKGQYKAGELYLCKPKGSSGFHFSLVSEVDTKTRTGLEFKPHSKVPTELV